MAGAAPTPVCLCSAQCRGIFGLLVPLARVCSLPGHVLSAGMPGPQLNALYLRSLLVSVIAVAGRWGSLRATGMPALSLMHWHGAVIQRKALPTHISMQNQLPPGKNLRSLLSVRLQSVNKIPDLFMSNLSHRARGLQGVCVPSDTFPVFSGCPTQCISFYSCNFYHLPASALPRAASHASLLSLGSLPPRWRSSHPRAGILGNSLKTQGQHSAGSPCHGEDGGGENPRASGLSRSFLSSGMYKSNAAWAKDEIPVYGCTSGAGCPSATSCWAAAPAFGEVQGGEKPTSSRKKVFLCQSPLHHVLPLA